MQTAFGVAGSLSSEVGMWLSTIKDSMTPSQIKDSHDTYTKSSKIVSFLAC